MHTRRKPPAPVVLVADDDPAMRDFAAHVLRDAGYNVRKAMAVPEAIECLRLPGVSAAVVDMLFVNSGDHTGLDILRFIRTQPALERVPVMMITGFPLKPSVVAEVHALRAELWAKPIDPAFLVQRVHTLLQLYPGGV